MANERIKNVMTEHNIEEYARVTRDIKGIEAALEKFFEMAFETTAANIERDFHFTEI